MKIVIPLGKGSAWNNGELLFAIRSYEKYIPHDEIIIVGERPDWIQNITHIPMADLHGRRAWNIARKALKACEQLKEPFMFSNDDHFAIAPLTFLPNYYNGKMSEQKGMTSSYQPRVQKTMKVLSPGALFYDIHTPMMISPVLFKNIVESYDCEHNEYVMKSLYGNNVTYPNQRIPDPLVRGGLPYHSIIDHISKKPFFSIDDSSLNKPMKQVLNDLFPDKSKYEK